jgi:hypothetical protein
MMKRNPIEQLRRDDPGGFDDDAFAKSSKNHECEQSATCICPIYALEPHYNCPRHGHPYPPRCDCGRFVSQFTRTNVATTGHR